MDSDESLGVLERLRANKDFGAIEALISYLRSQLPRSVPTAELTMAVARPKRQVYGLVKLARMYLLLTSGEGIPNIRKVGYRIDVRPRSFLFESIKSGNRADGHLGMETKLFHRVNRAELTSIEDIELHCAQHARTVIGKARLELSEKMDSIFHRKEKNVALADRANNDAQTPWQEIGLDDPNKN